jgi:hypothetical protein
VCALRARVFINARPAADPRCWPRLEATAASKACQLDFQPLRRQTSNGEIHRVSRPDNVATIARRISKPAAVSSQGTQHPFVVTRTPPRTTAWHHDGSNGGLVALDLRRARWPRPPNETPARRHHVPCSQPLPQASWPCPACGTMAMSASVAIRCGRGQQADAADKARSRGFAGRCPRSPIFIHSRFAADPRCCADTGAVNGPRAYR